MEDHVRSGKSMDSFVKGDDGLSSDAYLALTGYLNIHELVAVGIKNKVFDKNVCYNFWSDALVDHTNKAQKLIDLESSVEGWEASFLELRKLSVKWEKRNLKWQAKQRKKLSGKLPLQILLHLLQLLVKILRHHLHKPQASIDDSP